MRDALITGLCVACYAGVVTYYVRTKSEREKLDRLLKETRQTNAELAEAIALAQYGAADEAVEVLQRCTKRIEEGAV